MQSDLFGQRARKEWGWDGCAEQSPREPHMRINATEAIACLSSVRLPCGRLDVANGRVVQTRRSRASHQRDIRKKNVERPPRDATTVRRIPAGSISRRSGRRRGSLRMIARFPCDRLGRTALNRVVNGKQRAGAHVWVAMATHAARRQRRGQACRIEFPRPATTVDEERDFEVAAVGARARHVTGRGASSGGAIDVSAKSLPQRIG